MYKIYRYDKVASRTVEDPPESFTLHRCRLLGGVLTKEEFCLMITIGKYLDSAVNLFWNGGLLPRLVEMLNFPVCMLPLHWPVCYNSPFTGTKINKPKKL